MHLSPNEVVLKIYYHHYTPFITFLLKIMGATIPFYILIYIFRNTLTFKEILVFHLFIVVVFAVITIYQTLVYWLDRLIVTNRRLIYIDWQYLSVKKEFETELHDIQEIFTIEPGIFAMLPFFDYGTLEVKTASFQPTIIFEQAPNPNGIKKFILSILIHK